MQIILVLMQIVTILVFVFILLSKFSIFHSFYMVLIYLFYANINKDGRFFKGKYNYIYYLLIFIIILNIIEFIICMVNDYHTPLEYVAGIFVGGIVSFITFFVLFLIIGKKN